MVWLNNNIKLFKCYYLFFYNMPCSNCKEKGHNIRSCQNNTGTFKDSDYDIFNYKGQMKNGKPNGNGKGEWIGEYEGYSYIGEWKDGKRHGKGNTKNILRNTEEHTDMIIYEGNWVNDTKQGYGVYKDIENGNCIHIYKGNWLDDEESGYGILTLNDILEEDIMTTVYKGEWLNGKRSGFGIEIDPDGTEYKGMWENNLENGYGTTICRNGDKHEGNYKDGERYGDGIYYFLGTGDRYEGNFLHGNMSGKGIMYEREGTRFEGMWKNDEPFGFGITYDEKGNKLSEGIFNNDGLNGHGISIENGIKYEGEFINGIKNGLFKITYKDNSISEQFIDNDSINLSRKIKCKQIEKIATDNCPICQEKISSNITITKCNHTFHSSCLFEWFSKGNNCPMCRTILIENI